MGLQSYKRKKRMLSEREREGRSEINVGNV
jgi:hypothetical protein